MPLRYVDGNVCSLIITVASYRSRRHQIVEEVPGLYIRRLTLEDPKSARERPDSGVESSSSSSARHVCRPRASYLPSGRPRPTSSYKSWLEQIRRERQAVLTITSLQLPECPVPLIDSLGKNHCRPINSRDGGREESLTEIFDKPIEGKALRSLTNPVSIDPTEQHYEIERCCDQQIVTDINDGTSSEAPSTEGVLNIATYDQDKEEDHGDDDCICTEMAEKLRINIRKKTEVTRTGNSRSPSPEVTHTIRIAMKCPGRNREYKEPCCPGVSVALDFTLNCTSVQLTSRDVRPIDIGDHRSNSTTLPAL